MPENMSTVVELVEQREREAYEELGKLSFNDPMRSKILNEAKTYSEIRNSYEQAEQDRLSSYARNEIESQKLELEEKKAKTDKVRIAVDVGKAILYLSGGMFAGLSGRMLDVWVSKDARLGRWQERLHDLVIKK